MLEGAASFIAGAVAFFLLPDFPGSSTGSARWLLTEEERFFAKDRIIRDQVSNQESDHSILYGLKLAVRDFRVWAFVSLLRRFGLPLADRETGSHPLQ